MAKGKVKIVNEDRNGREYGFIITEKEELFFHSSNVLGEMPKKNDAVEFDYGTSPKGSVAQNVRVIAELTTEETQKLKFPEDIRAKALNKRREQVRSRKKKKLPITKVVGRRDYRIESLMPSAEWLLLIDETGDSFIKQEGNDEIVNEGGDKNKMGKFVGVLVPLPSKLTALPKGVHFADMDDIDEMDRILQQLLDHPVGIWGIAVSDLPDTLGDRWVDGVMHVVGWVLRLLPIDNSNTNLEIVVEQRGEHKKDSPWEAVLRTVVSGLAETNPDRYGKINASISIAGKSGGKWEKYQAYVDAVAHSWGSSLPDAKARLTAGNLRLCLHSGDGKKLRELWDKLSRGQDLDPSEWRKLFSDAALDPKGSICRTLLAQLGESCKSDLGLWKKLLDASKLHLESKAVALSSLASEIQWLACNMPEEGEIPELPETVELTWLTALLENGNHVGMVEFEHEKRLIELSEKLFVEEPRSVCQADLAQAVMETNRFDFDAASSAMARWEGLDMVASGRRHWSRLQSSHGQHAAFRGDLVSARESFLLAIDGFEGLSDDEDAFREISQTSCYLAIASMDDPEVDEKDVRKAVARVTGELDAKRIGELSKSTAPGEKFAHHLLLRFLRCRGSEEDRLSYLGEKDQWGVDEGHPWPLIQAYRGILLHPQEPARAVRRMIEASRMALDPKQGPTVRMIGLTLGIIAMGWGAKPMVTEQDLDEIENLLPAAKERVAFLREALSNLYECSETLLEKVLPFNFR